MINFNKRVLNFIIGLLMIVGFFIPVKGYAQGRCLIVSDIHFNPFYDNTLLSKLQNAPYTQWEEILKSSPKSMQIDSTLLGKDANYGVLMSSIKAIKTHADKKHPIEFVIIAGDFIWHNGPTDSALKVKSIRFIAKLFRDNMDHTIPIIAALGNNDNSTGDYLKQSGPFLDAFTDAWKMKENGFMLDSLKTAGYYTFEPTGKNLKIVVLNSTYVGYSSWVKNNYPAEAKRMLTGVAEELSKAKKTQQKVWLITHTPPGQNGYGSGSPMWQSNYTQIYADTIAKYCSADSSSTVQFMISSHTHLNDFRVLYDKAGKPISYIRLVPSIGTDHRNNPSFEIAEFDAFNHVTTETNYSLNLRNVAKGWNNTFSLPSSLGLKEISAVTLSEFLKNMRANSTELDNFSKYYNLEPDLKRARQTDFYKNFASYLNADGIVASE